MPHQTDIHVGRKLREARIAKGLTQTELGKALGVSFQQVQKYEKGTNRIGSSRLWDICVFLSLSVSYFFEGLKRDGRTPTETALSARAIQLAKEIEEIPDAQIKTSFVNLVRSYAKSG